MAKKIELAQKAKLHNEFRIVLTDTRTGKVKRDVKAYNIVLDKGLERWVNQFCEPNSISGTFQYARVMRPDTGYVTVRDVYGFGGAIFLGTGTGTLDRTRTGLFSPLSRLTADFYDRSIDQDAGIAKYTQYVVTTVGQFAGNTITEVGLGPDGDDISPSTHALIEDAQGKALGVDIGEMDVLTIYASTYMQVSHAYGANVGFVGGNSANILLRMVGDNAGFNGKGATSSNYYRRNVRLLVGKQPRQVNLADKAVLHQIGSTNLENGIKDLENFKAKFVFPTFQPAEANSPLGIREVGVALDIANLNLVEFNKDKLEGIPLFRSVMPVTDVFEGKDIEDDELGTGDGEQTTFDLKWADIVENSDKIYVTDRTPELQVRDTDYVFNNTLVPYDVNYVFLYQEIALEGGTTTGDLALVTTGSGVSVSTPKSGTTYTSNPAIILSYQKAVSCHKLKLQQRTTGGGSAKDFDLQGSDDLESWTKVLSDQLPNTTGWYEFTFNKLAFKHWKVVMKTSHSSTSGNLVFPSIELYQAEHQIEFMVPPEIGTAVTGNYTVPYIPKDSDRVVDVSFAIQFSDANAEEEEE